MLLQINVTLTEKYKTVYFNGLGPLSTKLQTLNKSVTIILRYILTYLLNEVHLPRVLVIYFQKQSITIYKSIILDLHQLKTACTLPYSIFQFLNVHFFN